MNVVDEGGPSTAGQKGVSYVPSLTWRSASSARACLKGERFLILGGGRHDADVSESTTVNDFFVLGAGVMVEVVVNVVAGAVIVLVPVVQGDVVVA